MEAEEIKLKGGATEYGRVYEQRIAALLAIKCAMDPNVEDFWIVSNIDGVGAFDDLVLWIEYTDKRRKMYCIQLKHIENNPMKIKDLAAEKSKFSLYKYQESYKEIKSNIDKINILKDISIDQIFLILYTNAPVSGNKTDDLVLKNRDSIELLNTSSVSNNVFEACNTTTSKKPFDEQFLQQFYLFERQASATQMDRLIKNEFYSHFQDVGDMVLITITDYFAKWSIGRNKKITKVFKKDVQKMLLEFLLLPHSMEPCEVAEKDASVLNILNDTLTNFNVTAISRENLIKNVFASIKCILGKLCGTPLNFQFSWNTHLRTEQLDYLMAESKEREKKLLKKCLQEKQRYVPYLTVKDLYFAAWQCKINPLVINCNIYQNSVEQILVKFKNVTKDLSFVLLNPSNMYALIKNLKVFRNFNDIDDSNLLIRNLENTYISLQGKGKVQLRDFMESHDILEQLTPDVYMLLMDGVLQVGPTNEIDDCYKKRSIRRPMLSSEVLDKVNLFPQRDSSENQHGDIFLLVDFTGDITDMLFIPQAYTNNAMDLSLYLANTSVKTSDEVYIITTPLSPTDELVMRTVTQIHQETAKAVHVVRMNLIFLEWIFSQGSVASLQEHYVDPISLEDGDETCIPEDDVLMHFTSTTNLISGYAGMGKSLFLRSLANKFDCNNWVCYIDLSEHVSNILEARALDTIFNYVFDCQMMTSDRIIYEFSKRIFLYCYEKNSMVWLLDGYDKVSSENMLSFLVDLKHFKLKTWIATTPMDKSELEMKLNTLSLEITSLEKDDNVSFLMKSLYKKLGL